jgi:hypothetical protein
VRAYYESRKTPLQDAIAEYEEREQELKNRLVDTKVSPEVIRTVTDYAKQYGPLLAETNDLQFWRGIVDDLDLTGEIGTDAVGEYVDFVLFDEVKQRTHLKTQERDIGGGTGYGTSRPQRCSFRFYLDGDHGASFF